MLYGLAVTPTQGTLAFVLYTIGHLSHSGGIFPYFMDLGGEDTAVLSAVSGSVADTMVILRIFSYSLVAFTIISTTTGRSFLNDRVLSRQGWTVPPLALWMRSRTGSWFPHIAAAAVLQLGAGAWWLRHASVRPARQLLKEMRECGELG